MTDLSNSISHDEARAHAHLESLIWANGRCYPNCGEAERTSFVKDKSHRPGLYYCLSCKKQFTVTVGTLFERSKVPLHKWVLAFHLMSASKKGISSHQLHRMLGVTYKTAWFMTHRIREAIREDNPGPLGGKGVRVEVDETYLGKPDCVKAPDGRWQKKRGHGSKMAVLTLVERDGKARSFHIPNMRSTTLRQHIFPNVDRKSDLRTDQLKSYTTLGREFASHETVNHNIGEYARGDAGTQVVENYYSIFKHGLIGVYQHISAKHLKRYTCEFDYRYNFRHVTDSERAQEALKGISGKRLTYRQVGAGQAA